MNKKGLIGVLAVISLIIIFSAYPISYAFTSGEETITIREKWVKYQGEGAKYLISSEDDQVFQITNTVLHWRFDGSNLYARLREGDTCKIKTQGWRFPLFSDYKNILEADCK